MTRNSHAPLRRTLVLFFHPCRSFAGSLCLARERTFVQVEANGRFRPKLAVPSPPLAGISDELRSGAERTGREPSWLNPKGFLNAHLKRCSKLHSEECRRTVDAILDRIHRLSGDSNQPSQLGLRQCACGSQLFQAIGKAFSHRSRRAVPGMRSTRV